MGAWLHNVAVGLPILVGIAALIAVAGWASHWLTKEPTGREPAALGLLRRWAWRKSTAASAWCSYCHSRPRTTLSDGETRYCSPECQREDREMQAHG